MKGTLSLISVPIGNPDDITHRALATLRDADLVVCEEWKEGGRLLSRYGITGKPLETLNEHDEDASTSRIMDHLVQGKNVALISDAGTPVFSDPGRSLVLRAAEAGVAVVPVPGPSSLVPALTVSGFAVDRFVYCGFLSPKAVRRKAELRKLRHETRAMVLLDTPYRLVPLVRDLAEVFGDERRICVAFNLTMPDETIFRGTPTDLLRTFEEAGLKGEFVLVVEGLRGPGGPPS